MGAESAASPDDSVHSLLGIGRPVGRPVQQAVGDGCRQMPVPIALLALVLFCAEPLITLAAMLLLRFRAAVRAIEIRVVPEIVGEERLSQATACSTCTNIAVITGSLLAGPLSTA